jgi:hypothetical protein
MRLIKSKLGWCCFSYPPSFLSITLTHSLTTLNSKPFYQLEHLIFTNHSPTPPFFLGLMHFISMISFWPCLRHRPELLIVLLLNPNLLSYTYLIIHLYLLPHLIIYSIKLIFIYYLIPSLIFIYCTIS